jgi:hypothetical protein
VQPGIQRAVGLEVDEIKCLKSESVIRGAFTVARDLANCENCVEPVVLHKDIEKVRVLPRKHGRLKLLSTQENSSAEMPVGQLRGHSGSCHTRLFILGGHSALCSHSFWRALREEQHTALYRYCTTCNQERTTG